MSNTVLPFYAQHNPELMLQRQDLIRGKEYLEFYQVNNWLRVRKYIHGETPELLGCSGDIYKVFFYIECDGLVIKNKDGVCLK